jgi:outer membrane protein OmpA-like peptidoglycan-associated protein
MPTLLRIAALLTLASGCNTTSTAARCAPEVWQGECQLASVTKVEDAEFPIPHVVMEAVYRPVQNAQYPGYTPGAISRRTMAKSQYELALYDFLEAHPRVSCNTEAPRGGACVAPTVAVGMPPFDPETAAKNTAAPPVTGCAQIEATSTQDRLRSGQQTNTFVSQHVAFAENSAELPPDADQLTGEVAKLLLQKPGIECLGIVGQITSGESPGLAEARANAVRGLLGAHGVSLARLLTIGATAKVFGNGSRPADPEAKDRKVSFTVLLESPPTP